VIRERNANYHVFVFIDGARPNDELITASLEKAGAPVEEAHHATEKPANVKAKAKVKTTKARASRATARHSRKRRR